MKYVKGKKTNSLTKVLVGVGAAFLAALIVLVIAIGVWYQQQLKPLTTESQKILFDVQKGESAASIAKDLQNKKVIRSSTAFLWYLRAGNLRGNIQAGRYQLDSSDSAPKIAKAITSGQVQTNLFTILPGERLDQTRDSLIRAGFAQDQVDEALNPANYVNHPALAGKPSSSSLEGYLYPDSFERTSSTTPEQIVRQSLDEMAEALTPNLVDGLKSQGLTVHQAITLASIVLKEATKQQDRQKIAGVFFNRLAIEMPLGSDTTYQYVADKEGLQRSADIDSPYNTRKYRGLPPGPISNINIEALAAVANPTKSDYLFFVAGDDGTVYFSKTQTEHDDLVRKYCKVLCNVY